MCGIIGHCVERRFADSADILFQKHLKKMHYRGPDFSTNKSHYLNNYKINFGFNRLSIQDLSPTSNKIFCDENHILIFNGEIYNKLELKNKHITDVVLQTTTDTEILFELLKKFSITKIDEIEGIFAFAFLNLKTNKIYLSRDRTGVKTLYYFKDISNFYFCSEAWYLYDLSSKKEIDFSALNFYLRFGFNDIKKNIFKNILKVLPGTYLEYNIMTKSIFEKRFFKKKNNLHLNIDMKQLEYNVIKSIEYNLLSDVKIGTFLSGGVDSSIISIIAKQKTNIESFTNYYDDPIYNKKNSDIFFSEYLSKYLNINLKKNFVTFNKDSNEIFKKSLEYFDEPLANLNIFNSFIQSKLAKECGYKVILTGDGGDEIFGGYDKYRNMKIATDFKFLSFISKKIFDYNNVKKNEIPYFFFKKLNTDFIKYLFKNEISSEIIASNSHLYESKLNSKNSISNEFDLDIWMISDHNYKLDRTTMAHSIEGRVPFQTKLLIENYSHINVNKKINYVKTKTQLRNLSFLPANIKRRKKQGWFLPENWFVTNFIKQELFDIISDDTIFFNKENIYKLFDRKYFKKLPRYEIITIFMFAYWIRKIKF
tara:strand:- start:1005 stop:2786 length:1782 start_codon:yes stop_codon:yes gene_type:complete